MIQSYSFKLINIIKIKIVLYIHGWLNGKYTLLCLHGIGVKNVKSFSLVCIKYARLDLLFHFNMHLVQVKSSS